MSKIKDGNYIVIQSFMVKDLKLKGTELLVYAIIYGFSQAENQAFNGSLQYLADWTNCTKQGIIKNLKSLTQKGFIEKKETMLNDVKFCEYRSTKFNAEKNKVYSPVKQSLTDGIKQSLNNNISSDNKEYNKENNTIESEFEELWKIYPRKDGKKAAFNAFKRALHNGTTTYIIKQGISRYLAYIRQNNISLRYIKMGSTWFNGECWNDDYDIKVTCNNGYNNGVTDDLDEVFGGG